MKNTNLEDIGNQNENSEKENKLLNNDEVESQKNSNISEDKNKKDYRKLKNTYGLRRYKIQEVIKPGPSRPNSSPKEERGQKGAALTTFYFVSREVYGSYA